MKSEKVHKQSLGHPWPSSDPPHTGSVYPGGSQDCAAKINICSSGVRCEILRILKGETIKGKTAATERRQKTVKTFLGRTKIARELGASSIQHGSVRTGPLSGNRGGAIPSCVPHNHQDKILAQRTVTSVCLSTFNTPEYFVK